MSTVCPACGAAVPEAGAACGACGATGAARDDDTRVEPLPAGTAGPIHYDVATTHWFGVTPASVLLALAALAAIASIVLFAVGRWPLGLIGAGVVLLLLAAFGEVARRKPDAEVAARSLTALRGARERAGVAVATANARTRARRELNRVRYELLDVEQRRRERIGELGEASFAGDAERTETLKAEIGELERLAREKEAEMETITEQARAGIARTRLPVQDTQMVEPAEPPREPGEPAEPTPEYPPPDEGTPPEPARIPEPYPPDEITPPESGADRHTG